jgi:hypothetical protein
MRFDQRHLAFDSGRLSAGGPRDRLLARTPGFGRENNLMSSSMQMLTSRWETARPAAIALVVGLIAGPLISNYAGWQVTSQAAQAQVQAGIVEQQALFCDVRARADVAMPQSLSFDARYDLAKKWAIMPGATEALSGVVSACAGKLAI